MFQFAVVDLLSYVRSIFFYLLERMDAPTIGYDNKRGKYKYHAVASVRWNEHRGGK